MDINRIISSNLTAWMESGKGPTTLKEVARRSGVGFGTAQRVKNGIGNTTIQNLDLIASAFGRSVIELISESSAYGTAAKATELPLNSKHKAAVYDLGKTNEDFVISEVVSILRTMDEKGRRAALKHVKLVAEEHSAITKTNKQR